MKQIQFGGAGGYYIYYIGLCQCLYEYVDHQLLKDFQIGGSSAGAVGALFLYLSLYIADITPNKLYLKYIINGLVDKGKKYYSGFILNGSNCTYIIAKKLYNDLNLKEIFENNKYFIQISTLPSFYPKQIYNFNTCNDFSSYISGTIGVPLLLKKNLFSFYNRELFTDGTISCYLNKPFLSNEDDKILYFYYDIRIFKDVQNIKYYNIKYWSKHTLSNFYLMPWMSIDHDMLYNQGYLDCLENIDEIISKLQNM